ncbi:hypothetical protein ILYODFUR_021796 [Ilyodon furcidens]|uniref:Uncharacterized protein n=1 Tax=Ilyodon furcidens TaxID=33524 RepID=A0ABV0V537_9TELE
MAETGAAQFNAGISLPVTLSGSPLTAASKVPHKLLTSATRSKGASPALAAGSKWAIRDMARLNRFGPWVTKGACLVSALLLQNKHGGKRVGVRASHSFQRPEWSKSLEVLQVEEHEEPDVPLFCLKDGLETVNGLRSQCLC